MSRIAFGIVIAVLTAVHASPSEAGDVYRKIASVNDPVVAPRAPDPDTLLPVARKTPSTTGSARSRTDAAKPAADWSEKQRFSRLHLPTLPAWPAASR